jgi:hypothetical protein
MVDLLVYTNHRIGDMLYYNNLLYINITYHNAWQV